MSRPVSEEDLHAFVDGQLDEERRRTVERYLNEHPEDAARVADYVAQRQALKAAMAFRVSTPAPPQLDLLRLVEGRMTRRRTPWRLAAAVALSLGIGGAAGWLSRGGLPPSAAGHAMAMLTSEAFATHAVYSVDARHPIEVDAAEREHLVHWLSNRLNRTLEAPDLRAAGFQLLGGRLLATERGNAAALFMYADSAGRRVSVLVRPMAAGIHVRQADTRSGHTRVCAWIGGGLGYAVAGALPDEQLDHISGLVRGPAGAPF